MGHNAVPGGDERFDELALGSWISLGYLQGYFMPQILNWIEIRGPGGPVLRWFFRYGLGLHGCQWRRASAYRRWNGQRSQVHRHTAEVHGAISSATLPMPVPLSK